MSDKYFLDSNIIIYAFGSDTRKKETAKSLLRALPIISTQVINETVNVCFRKLKFSGDRISRLINLLKSECKIIQIDLGTIELAIFIVDRYGYSYFDSLMIASSLENNCCILYTEDLQHNQLIENRLRIINPFETGKS